MQQFQPGGLEYARWVKYFVLSVCYRNVSRLDFWSIPEQHSYAVWYAYLFINQFFFLTLPAFMMNHIHCILISVYFGKPLNQWEHVMALWCNEVIVYTPSSFCLSRSSADLLPQIPVPTRIASAPWVSYLIVTFLKTFIQFVSFNIYLFTINFQTCL